MQQHLVNCPQCGKKVVWEPANLFRPFCSERCKTNDLSQWAQESYRIPGSAGLADSAESEKNQKNNE